jgi:hypothetical protein
VKATIKRNGAEKPVLTQQKNTGNKSILSFLRRIEGKRTSTGKFMVGKMHCNPNGK